MLPPPRGRSQGPPAILRTSSHRSVSSVSNRPLRRSIYLNGPEARRVPTHKDVWHLRLSSSLLPFNVRYRRPANSASLALAERHGARLSPWWDLRGAAEARSLIPRAT